MVWASLQHFYDNTESNVLHLQEEAQRGRKVVGQYCIYTPPELIVACDAIPVSLCGTKYSSIPAAEAILPRTLCPLIKSSFGYALEDSCPYLAASDLVVCDTTCDGKKKMFELLAKRKPVYVLELPQKQGEEGLAFWRRQLELFKAHLEKIFQKTISEDSLWQAIRLAQRFQSALKKVLDLGKRRPSPLSGMQLLEISVRASFMPDYEERITELEAIAKEIAADMNSEESKKEKAPRLLLTGVPVGIGSHKVVKLLEECGASVVCIDNCSCYKKVREYPKCDGDAMELIARHSLEYPCAVMSPNPGRYQAVENLVRDFSVDAVCDLTWQGCQTYDVESYSLREFVRNDLGLPFLQVVTDYSESDYEQLRIRIEAFLEMLD